jgi:hypothetical protein
VDLLLNSTVLQQHEDRILSRRCPAGFGFDQGGGARSSPWRPPAMVAQPSRASSTLFTRVRNDRAARSELIGGDPAGDDVSTGCL